MQKSSFLPSIREQAERLIELGVPELLGQTADQLRVSSQALEAGRAGDNTPALLVPSEIPRTYADLFELVRLGDKPGFVVVDFTDTADFIPVAGAPSKPFDLPGSPWYALIDPERGDELRNASPAEAAKVFADNGRLPLTLVEGIFLVLQAPELLERDFCFMTIGSRKPKGRDNYDARTPALWISNGTGRDGIEHRDAPKLGWCWWNNRHTWLGIAHADSRVDHP